MPVQLHPIQTTILNSMQLLQQPLVIVSAYKDKRKQELSLLLLLKPYASPKSTTFTRTPTFQTFKAHDLFSHPTAVQAIFSREPLTSAFIEIIFSFMNHVLAKILLRVSPRTFTL